MGWELVRRRPIVVEDFLPIPSQSPFTSIQPGRGGCGRVRMGGSGLSPLSHKPGALKMAFISQGRASSADERRV